MKSSEMKSNQQMLIVHLGEIVQRNVSSYLPLEGKDKNVSRKP